MIKNYIKHKLVYLIENRTVPILNKINRLQNYIDANLGRVDRKHIMEYAFEFAAKNDLDGSYLEFGCYSGNSFIRAYNSYQRWLAIASEKEWKMSPKTMYAFDSFKGLPDLMAKDQQPDYHIFDKGQYAYSEDDFIQNLDDAGVNRNMVSIVPGFYSESLTDDLKKNLRIENALIIHIDCDLYTSACSVLNFITDLLQDGTLLLFDDFFCYRGNPKYGVHRAFNEWRVDNDILVTDYMNYSWAGKAFIVNI